ncbi:MAG: (Fe-S)-binding protein [Nevskia sp.]|nr:(Fe-S)-binding protein [Nevskia sp.]
MSSSDPHAFPLEFADLCVKCGLCLPQCPTYLDLRQEGDSPRGRIALMQALAAGTVGPTPRLQAHLDGCLGCRACEKACPARVPYGALIDAGRVLLAWQLPRRRRIGALFSAILSRRWLRRLLAILLWTYQHSGAQAVLRGGRLLGAGRLARLESLLPPGVRRAAHAPAPLPGAPGVKLFTVCATDLAEPGLAADATRLLQACGYAVEAPARQTCCGALDQHGGRPHAAAALAGRNLRAFGDDDAPILPLASGCAATLLDYPTLLGDAEAQHFRQRLRDPGEFLLQHGAALRFRPLPARAALHLPCTLRNVVGDNGAWRALLGRIPELDIVELDPAQRCCGAAGSHFLTQPQAADRILEPKLAAARALRPDLVVSANVGCSLHLAGGLRRSGLRTEVLHPLALLARQMA